jgi:hypothetical protein
MIRHLAFSVEPWCLRETGLHLDAGFSDPEVGQIMINVTDGKLIRLLVDDEPFVRYGEAGLEAPVPRLGPSPPGAGTPPPRPDDASVPGATP